MNRFYICLSFLVLLTNGTRRHFSSRGKDLFIMDKDGTFIAGAPISDQELLVKYIFEDKQYDPLFRPVLNRNETIQVKVGLAMIQIVQLVSLH